ncbi:hypothetical protein SISSUDRAFT_568584 [Sistotremastrum suecicum HHB10207 ss-3]|uniref:Uncharacterized protein n=1 Tax=Sistotremastrum suecicum HHB10207 ss-3 TaxID=1314776 RepID=A0A165XIE2_9AGAM|nr:hypothetical protein SISSUDRAFT_568584 [Sistotremastrum suecicum HHB10207 ss-3]
MITVLSTGRGRGLNQGLIGDALRMNVNEHESGSVDRDKDLVARRVRWQTGEIFGEFRLTYSDEGPKDTHDDSLIISIDQKAILTLHGTEIASLWSQTTMSCCPIVVNLNVPNDASYCRQ